MGRSRVRLCLLFAALLCGAAAHAATVALEPVRVHLSGTNRSQGITLTNSGKEGVRFQVSAFSWQQSLSGEMQLGPTQDLVYSPSLLELAPGESRRIRVASATAPRETEKNYRLFLDELPPLGNRQVGTVRVLTRLGVPVFLQPANPVARPLLDLRAERGHLFATLENRGNSYLLAQSVRLVGRSSSGAVLLQEDLPGWYVLAGGRRVYDVALSREVCSALVDVNITAKTDHGVAQLVKKLPTMACGSS